MRVGLLVVALLLLPVPTLAASSTFHVTVDATANIFAAESGDASGNGGGTAPVRIPIPAGATIVRLTSVRGRVSCCGSGGPFNDANGGTAYSTSIQSSGGVSGITYPGVSFFLAGVFVGENPSGSVAPAPLNVSNIPHQSDVSPLLDQTFFAGDGHFTRVHAMGTRNVHIPIGAKYLVLGFADSMGFNGVPGAYGDNVGRLDVRGMFNATASGHPRATPSPSMPTSAKPCYVNSGAYASVAPCFGPIGTTIVVTLVRDMPAAAGQLRFDRVLTSGVPASVLETLSGSGTTAGSTYTATADSKLCAGPGFPKKWNVWLIDINGTLSGEIGEFTIQGCP